MFKSWRDIQLRGKQLEKYPTAWISIASKSRVPHLRKGVKKREVFAHSLL